MAVSPAELRAWRTAADMTLYELGLALGVDQQTIWRWEHERRAIPPFLSLALEGLGRRISESQTKAS